MQSSTPAHLVQHYNRSVALISDIDARKSVYAIDPSLPKPCVHPIVTAGGTTVTCFEPSDHVWHRGLWFTIKYINRDNFWEEHDGHGVQKALGHPEVDLLETGCCRLGQELEWTSGALGKMVHERRTITTRLTEDKLTIIDWATSLRFEKDAELDRTPFTTFGGYGGMSIRASRELHGGSFTTPASEKLDAISGEPHEWVLLSASVDGGPSKRVSIGIIDHPSNPRYPTPWYCKAQTGSAPRAFNFMNAAFLFHEPMQVTAGQTLAFCYRIIVRDGIWTAEEFGKLAAQFKEERPR